MNLRSASTMTLLTLMALAGPQSVALSQPRDAAAPATQATPAEDPVAIQLFARALDAWKDGRQSAAEAILSRAAPAFPNDQRLAFFLAACYRSRFDIAQADQQFTALIDLGRDTAYGKCAAALLILDAGQNVNAGFAELQQLAAKHPDDVLLLWMAAVECRQHNRNALGVEYYTKLAAAIAPAAGPVLVHQTWANLLDELKRYDEALVHRKQAVLMEPAGWSYDGMGNTLRALRRFDEADKAFANAVALQPNRAQYFYNWAYMLFEAARYDAACEKAQRALDVDAGFWAALNLWGLSLDRLGRVDEALQKFEKTRELAPREPDGYISAIDLLRRVGRKQEADDLAAQLDNVTGVRPRGARSPGRR